MTAEIQRELCKYLILCGRETVCENVGYHSEMDVAAVSKSDMLYEFEVKISRSDFLADKKKEKFKRPATADNSPNYFSYVCPKGMIDENEIPPYAGLYYYENGRFFCMKSPKRIHKIPVKKELILSRMLRLTAQRKYLGCALLTYLNKPDIQ